MRFGPNIFLSFTDILYGGYQISKELYSRMDGRANTTEVKVYLCANISLSRWHLSSLKRGLRTLGDMFVKRLVDKYRRELIKPSFYKRGAPSACLPTYPASSCSTDRA